MWRHTRSGWWPEFGGVSAGAETQNAAPRGALSGVRVCDFSWVGAGPRATKELADHGAEVIKIESRKRLDPSRLTPPFVNGKGPDHSAFFVMSNTSKKSVCINLSDPRGQKIAKDIALTSHMVVENFGTGFMERIGMGWDTLHAEKPDLAMVSVSIAGRTGPLAGFRGYGNSAAATSGQALVTGFPDGEPHLTNYAYGDVATPLFAAIAMMGALDYQRRTGRGIHVDVCQLESMMQLLSPAFLAQAAGETPQRLGNRETWCAPNGAFPTAQPGRWVAITIADDKDWVAFCDVSGMDVTRLATTAERLANVEAAEAAVIAWTSTREPAEIIDRLQSAGIAVALVQNGQEVSEDPQLLHRHIADPIVHPKMGAVRHVAPAFKLSRTPAKIGVAPLIGQDAGSILGDLLGMSKVEVDALADEGVLV